MINKKIFPWLFLFIGVISIIISLVWFSLYWGIHIDFTFSFLFFLVFFTILLIFGIFCSVEGIRYKKSFRIKKSYSSLKLTKILGFFFLFALFGAALYYNNYYHYLQQKDHGPYLSWTDDPSTTMTITWETYISDPIPKFEWGKNPSKLTETAIVGGTNHHHTVTLKGLLPDTKYYYRIPDFLDEPTSFKTAPEQGSRTPFTFLFYGDSREGDPSSPDREHAEIIGLMEEEKNVRFVLQAGDIANNYNDNHLEQWDYNFFIIRNISKSIPYMPVAGNHDWWTKDKVPATGQDFLNFYELPTDGPDHDETSYYFDCGNVFVLVIGYDQQELAAPENYDSEYVRWVRSTLIDAKSSGLYDWIFVMFHKPPFSMRIKNGHIEEPEYKVRYWHPIFMECGVDFVLNGHNHHYERTLMGYSISDIGTHNITYIVSGAGGGGAHLHGIELSVYDSQSENVNDLNYYGRTLVAVEKYHYNRISIDGTSLRLTTIDETGFIIDECTFSK